MGKIIGIFMIAIAIFVVTIVVLTFFLRSERLRESVSQKKIQQLQIALSEKIKEKIELTQRSKSLKRQKDELIASYIYKQSHVRELAEEVQSIHADEFALLKTRYPQLTELDRLFICLLGIDMCNDEIADLLCMEKKTLYRRRQLISQRIGISSTQLDQFAQELVGRLAS